MSSGGEHGEINAYVPLPEILTSIHEFADPDITSQETFGGLVSLILTSGNVSITEVKGLIDPASVMQQRLEKAVTKVLETRFTDPLLPQRELMPPWEGAYAIIILNREGRIVAAADHPGGHAYPPTRTNVYHWDSRFSICSFSSGQFN